MAVITFTQLDDDVFVVSHRVKGLGLRGKAMKLVYTKTASLCTAAGFSHFKILDQESETGQQYEVANASIRARFYLEGGDERVGCERSSNPSYVEQASEKLARKGYRPPERKAESSSAADSEVPGGNPVDEATCTIEQVAAMARSGLTDEQILAACVQ